MIKSFLIIRIPDIKSLPYVHTPAMLTIITCLYRCRDDSTPISGSVLLQYESTDNNIRDLFHDDVLFIHVCFIIR